MSASGRLKPIKRIADKKEKVAAEALGKSVENSKQQQNKLEQLKNYRTEYLTSMLIKTEQGMSGDQLHQYHQFLNKLDSIISQQNEAVQQSNYDLSECQTQWQSDNSRASAIGKVICNKQENEAQIANKKEAAQLDEMSTQAFLRRKINH